MSAHLKLAQYDAQLRLKYGPYICGVDECGRGSWAGPIVAAACVLPPDAMLPGLNDSKKMTPETREKLAEDIRGIALAFSIVEIPNHRIDKNGLNPCNALCMLQSSQDVADSIMASTGEPISVFVVDQSPPFKLHPHLMMSKADGTSLAVAAASVIAKTWRDNLMKDLAKEFPLYHWDTSMGYINDEHKNAVLAHGLTRFHRRSYQVTGVNKPRQVSFDELM